MELFTGTTAFHHGTTFAPGLAGGTPKGDPSEDGRLVERRGPLWEDALSARLGLDERREAGQRRACPGRRDE